MKTKEKYGVRSSALFLKSVKTCLLMTADIISVLMSAFLSFSVISYMFEEDVLPGQIAYCTPFYLTILVFSTLLINLAFRLYSSILIYAGTDEALRVASASFLSAAIFAFAIKLSGAMLMPGILILYFCFLCTFVMISRFFRKVTHTLFSRTRERFNRNIGDRIMLIGAGTAGSLLLKLIQIEFPVTHKSVVCIIDDNPLKIGSILSGVPVIGGRGLIVQAVKEYNIDEIILAVPSISQKDRSDILTICSRTPCRLLILPNIYSTLKRGAKHDELREVSIREVRIEDLLGRNPVKLENEPMHSYIYGKRILVTGGGGSIGSELCRQIAIGEPSLLVILDIYENTTYELEVELRRKYPTLNLAVVICNICDRELVESVYRKYKPDVVFHAAAHKHVPLMEENVREAVKNNVFGTLNLVRAADCAGVGRFVLISSDKAVRPTNVMGVTKRICEMIVQTYGRISQTNFVAVRFGNVLGSHGSVVPLFCEQIARGGPVYVTHPDITRYFMTITEAVSLVLEAGVYAKGGEIFVLDMGKPVKIVDLARNLIGLYGFIPDKDIKIEYIGLRPGEKLYEELLIDRQKMIKTQNKLIFVEKPDYIDENKLWPELDRLASMLTNEQADLRGLLHEIVPEYDYENNHTDDKSCI